MAGPIRSLPSRAKKRKVHADSTTTQAIRRLEADLTRGLSENTSLNPLVDLLDLALATKNPQQCSRALDALYRVFVLIISNTNLGSGGDEAAKVVKAWLWDRLNIYVDYLGGLLKDEDKSLRVRFAFVLYFKILTVMLYRLRRFRYYSRFRSTCRRHTLKQRRSNPSSTYHIFAKLYRFSYYVHHRRGPNKNTLLKTL